MKEVSLEKADFFVMKEFSELSGTTHSSPYTTPFLFDIGLYWAVKMLIHWAEMTNQLKSKQTILPQRVFYLLQFSINCLACPKKVKCKQISNKQAVSL
jgi:hypothetical protein